jgi:AcrR family transcriptional regulator
MDDLLTTASTTSSVASRPVRRRGQIARARIVDSAADLFYRNGVARTGIAEIGDASHTGKGQLYHYFAGKNEIVSAVIEHQTQRIIQAQQDLFDAMTTAQDVRNWANAAVSAHEGLRPARCPLGALTVGIGDVDPGLRRELDSGFIRWRMALAAGIARVQDAGEARTDRAAEDLAEVLLCAYEGGLVLAEAHGDVRPLRLVLEVAVESVLSKPGAATEMTI